MNDDKVKSISLIRHFEMSMNGTMRKRFEVVFDCDSFWISSKQLNELADLIVKIRKEESHVEA